MVSGFYEYAWRTDQIDRDLNEKLRGQARGSYRPYKAFLHHLGTTPIQRNVLRQPTDRRREPQTLTTTQIERVIETCKTQFQRQERDLIEQIDLGTAAGRPHWVDKNQKKLTAIQSIISALEQQRVHGLPKAQREYGQSERAKRTERVAV